MRTCAGIKDILFEETKLLAEIVRLEEETQGVLIQGDAKKLDELNQLKEKLLEQMGQLEVQRSDTVPDELTLKEYISREAPGDAAELEELRVQLLQLNNSLQRLQEINKHLLQHNLKFIQYAMQVLFPQQQQEHLYAPSGEMEKKDLPSSKLLDSNA